MHLNYAEPLLQMVNASKICEALKKKKGQTYDYMLNSEMTNYMLLSCCCQV